MSHFGVFSAMKIIWHPRYRSISGLIEVKATKTVSRHAIHDSVEILGAFFQ